MLPAATSKETDPRRRRTPNRFAEVHRATVDGRHAHSPTAAPAPARATRQSKAPPARAAGRARGGSARRAAPTAGRHSLAIPLLHVTQRSPPPARSLGLQASERTAEGGVERDRRPHHLGRHGVGLAPHRSHGPAPPAPRLVLLRGAPGIPADIERRHDSHGPRPGELVLPGERPAGWDRPACSRRSGRRSESAPNARRRGPPPGRSRGSARSAISGRAASARDTRSSRPSAKAGAGSGCRGRGAVRDVECRAPGERR